MLKKMAKLLSLVLVVVMIGALVAGCGTTTPPASTPAKKSIKFGVSLKDMSNPFFVEVRDAMKSKVKAGDELIYTDCQYNQAKQLNDIEDMIQQGVSAIFVTAVDWKGIKPALEACAKAKIPCIVVDSPVFDVDLATTTVASDNTLAGVLAGEAMVKKLGEKGSIVIYENSTSSPAQMRVAGFESVIKKYPNIKVVNRQNGVGKIEVALPIMENMLQANPEIVGVFAMNDPSALGCLSAVEAAGKLSQISIIGVDGSTKGKEMVKAGKLLGTSAQFPKKIGEYAVETAYKIIAGETVPKDVKVPVEFIDKSNVDKY